MRTRSYLYRIAATLFLGATCMASFAVAQPVTTDSRIKTFVYNANEVFAITTHYGYQSNIEFGPKEQIDTISVGDRVSWQIIPTGNRLFIRAIDENSRTNMTVVTNLRAYQFDLRSSSADAVFGSEELTYVVRFYYPDASNLTAYVPPSNAQPYVPTVMAAPVAPVMVPRPMPMAAMPVTMPVTTAPTVRPASPRPAAAAASQGPINYQYTYSGPSDIAPTKIYDDGKTTYFKIGNRVSPQVSIVTASGETVQVPSRRISDGVVAVDAVAPRFALSQAGRQVIVYNESSGEV